jgi:membrane associated rhomboid family serine protease
MHQASVGFHCPECTSRGKQKVYTARTLQSMNQPVVTITLIALNGLVYLASMSQGVNQFAIDYGLIGNAAVLNSGHVGLVGVAQGEWWRLITGGFLHANLIHIAFNMFALWVLGSQLEPALGRLRFGVVYFVSLLAGSLGVMLVSPDVVTVGASGAIFGLFGVAVAAQRSQGINIWQSGVGMILVINLALTFGVSGISIGGHIGGLIGGYLCGVILYNLGPNIKDRTIPVLMCCGLGLVCFVSAIAVAHAHV